MKELCLYPLRFREILRDYDFGARWIPEAFPGKNLPDLPVIAETWEMCCRPPEAGIVVNGELAGARLDEIVRDRTAELLGRKIVEQFGARFPLLIKFLDVTHNLAEQVHPDDVTAHKFGLEDPGKTEAWYMIFVKPGTTIRAGNLDGVTTHDVASSLITGTAPDLMNRCPIKAGDSFLLYGGTMHYSTGRMLLYEIMQNSNAHVSLRKLPEDIAADRKRSLMQKAEDAVRIEDGADFRTEPVTLPDGANRRTFVFACKHFALERLDLSGPMPIVSNGDRFCVLTQIEGSSRLTWEHGEETLLPGNSCLVPAGLRLAALAPEDRCALLRAYVPDLLTDIVEPLRRAGVPDSRIALLGARTRQNHLNEVLHPGHKQTP